MINVYIFRLAETWKYHDKLEPIVQSLTGWSKASGIDSDDSGGSIGYGLVCIAFSESEGNPNPFQSTPESGQNWPLPIC